MTTTEVLPLCEPTLFKYQVHQLSILRESENVLGIDVRILKLHHVQSGQTTLLNMMPGILDPWPKVNTRGHIVARQQRPQADWHVTVIEPRKGRHTI